MMEPLSYLAMLGLLLWWCVRCDHKWKLFETREVKNLDTGGPCGVAQICVCDKCGKWKRFNLTS